MVLCERGVCEFFVSGFFWCGIIVYTALIVVVVVCVTDRLMIFISNVSCVVHFGYLLTCMYYSISRQTFMSFIAVAPIHVCFRRMYRPLPTFSELHTTFFRAIHATMPRRGVPHVAFYVFVRTCVGLFVRS